MLKRDIAVNSLIGEGENKIFAKDTIQIDQIDLLAEKMGVSQSSIANKLRLLNLAPEVQDALLQEKISERKNTCKYMVKIY